MVHAFMSHLNEMHYNNSLEILFQTVKDELIIKKTMDICYQYNSGYTIKSAEHSSKNRKTGEIDRIDVP